MILQSVFKKEKVREKEELKINTTADSKKEAGFWRRKKTDLFTCFYPYSMRTFLNKEFI